MTAKEATDDRRVTLFMLLALFRGARDVAIEASEILSSTIPSVLTFRFSFHALSDLPMPPCPCAD